MARFTFGKYNLVASFPTLVEAAPAAEALQQELGAGAVSLLARDERDEDKGPDPAGKDEAAELTDDVAKGVAVGAATGTALGGIAGLIAGAAAVAIPGIGPGLATGIWAGVIGGAFGGGTAGSIAVAFKKMWDATYADTLREGGALIAVHTDDGEAFDRAAAIVHREGAATVHEYDHAGELVRSA